MLANAFLLLALAASALGRPKPLLSGCDISDAQINLPTTSPTLAPPTSRPSFIALSIGTQNYTCTSAGTYVYDLVSFLYKCRWWNLVSRNIGAVAELFDLSCLYKTQFQEAAYAAWKAAPASVTPQAIIDLLHTSGAPDILGKNDFIFTYAPH